MGVPVVVSSTTVSDKRGSEWLRGISLHVGLNTVDPAPLRRVGRRAHRLRVDANAMEALAQSRGFETTKLLTERGDGRRDHGRDRRARPGELEAGDIFFVTYSGHGGQVPDRNDEDEADGSDETWLAYDRQIVDDELYELWAKFKPGVRIIVLSDSCHSGSVNKAITNAERSRTRSRRAEEAAKQEPRFRAMPRDKMIATYRAEPRRSTTASRSEVAELGELGVGARRARCC